MKKNFRMIVDTLWIEIYLYLFVDCYCDAVNLENSYSTRMLNLIGAILIGVCIGLELYKIAEKVSNEHKNDLEDRIVELKKRIEELENKEN